MKEAVAERDADTPDAVQDADSEILDEREPVCEELGEPVCVPV